MKLALADKDALNRSLANPTGNVVGHASLFRSAGQSPASGASRIVSGMNYYFLSVYIVTNSSCYFQGNPVVSGGVVDHGGPNPSTNRS